MKNGYEAVARPNADTEWPTVFLKQGEHYISDSGSALVRTILGSCVTVTMHLWAVTWGVS